VTPPTGKVELHVAWQWTCDNCGRDNFVRAITYERDRDDPPEYEGMVTFPDELQCPYCNSRYFGSAAGDEPMDEEGEEWKRTDEK